MTKLRWISGLFGIILIFSLIISGCSKEQAINDNKKVIEFWTLQLSDFAPYLNNVIADYEKIHPDVKIKWVDVPFSEGEKRALAAVMSNKVPDVVNMNPSFGSTLASRNALLNVKKYVNKPDYDGVSKVLSCEAFLPLEAHYEQRQE